MLLAWIIIGIFILLGLTYFVGLVVHVCNREWEDVPMCILMLTTLVAICVAIS